MENGGNDKYWRGRTSNNNNNVWWDLAHLGFSEEEEEMGTFGDYWTSNVVLMNSSQDHHHQVVVEKEMEQEVVMMMNPPVSNGDGGGAKSKQQQYYLSSSSSSLYSAGSSHVYPDPHLTCLKLGNNNNNNNNNTSNNNKRRQYYYEDGTSNIISTTTTTTTTSLWKKGKCYSTGGCGGDGGASLVNLGFGSASTTVVIPRCQVDGCHVELLCAREYHRRHKVCEVHSKATKVEVLGIEQRFCQQCSRFHVMTEFDDSKRSCRRRLAGHNERRRKMSNNNSTTSSNDSTTINPSTTARKCFDQGGDGGLPHRKILSRPSVSNALSLLSTPGGFTGHTSIVPSQFFLKNQLARSIIKHQKMLGSCNKKENG